MLPNFSVVLLKGYDTSLTTCQSYKEVQACYLGFSVMLANVEGIDPTGDNKLDKLLDHMTARNTLPFRYKMVWQNSAVVHCTYNTLQNMQTWFAKDTDPLVMALLQDMNEECQQHIPPLIKSAVSLNRIFTEL